MSEFNNIMFSPLMRTNEVKRYSGTKLFEEESLSQHITDISMMSYMIAKKLNTYGENIDIGLLLEKCLIHDIDEIVTGDLPRNTKYANPNIKKEMDALADLAIVKLTDSLHGMEDMYEVWSTAKQGKEGFIVKLADMLCVVRKALIEVELYNNLICLKVIQELGGHLTSLHMVSNFSNEESSKFVAMLINEARKIIDELNKQYAPICEKYNITKNVLEV